MPEHHADVNDVSLELGDLRKTLESRTAELDAEKEAVIKLLRCCQTLCRTSSVLTKHTKSVWKYVGAHASEGFRCKSRQFSINGRNTEVLPQSQCPEDNIGNVVGCYI